MTNTGAALPLTAASSSTPESGSATSTGVGGLPTFDNHPPLTKALTLSPDPIRLAIDTPTDWPSVLATSFVGLTGALVALAVGGMAWMGQRNQIRAATANFRHGWQQDLRQLIAKFVALIARIHYELDGNPDYLKSSESNDSYTQLLETHANIELMLDPRKPYAKDISRLTEQLIDAVANHQGNQADELTQELIAVANGALEQAWRDIRNDLSGKS